MAKRREKGKIPHQEWPAIRTRYAAGESLAGIARDYGCTGPAIRYIVNRPVEADGPVPAAAEPARRSAPAVSEAPPPARPELSGHHSDNAPGHPDNAPGASAIDPELRWRVSSEIASFLAVFDSFLTEHSTQNYDELLDATDRLMRVAARTRIELERARTSDHSRLGRLAARTRMAAS